MTTRRRPANDPLFLQEPLDHRVEIPVLGIPVRFASNDRGILNGVIEVFGHWQSSDTGPPSTDPGADIRLFLHDGDEGPNERSITYRAPDPMRWIVHTPGSVGIADLERRTGHAWLTRALVDDRARFRVSILQFLVLIVITVRDRTPFHAALIAKEDEGLLLAGQAGVGKSTLAYYAWKSGLRVLSDDAAYVQLEPHRVWGSGPSVLLLEEVAQHADLTHLESTLFPTGKRKVVVSPPDSGRTKGWVKRARVCVLSRTGGPARVERITSDEVVHTLAVDPSGSGDRFGARLADAARRLAAGGGWKLSLSSNPMEAIPFIREMLSER